MSIQVTCPNGHEFKVKDHWAGRKGRCPKCNAWMAVPNAPAKISDDDALAMLSDSADDSSEGKSDDAANALDEYDAQLEIATSGLSLLGSGVIGGKKVCKKCGKEANHWSASCGHCGTYFDSNE